MPWSIHPLTHGLLPGVIGLAPRPLFPERYVVQAREWGCRLWLCLLGHGELEGMGLEMLPRLVREHGMQWRHAPIRDFGVPDETFLARWPDLSRQALAVLSQGHNVLIHCHGGLGRTGLVCAMLLRDMGLPPDEALAHVRQVRPGAIETPEQEAFVRSYAPALS